MRKVQLFMRENCLLCEEAEALLEAVQSIYDFTFEKINIDEDDHLLERYQIEIPVVRIGSIELNSNELSFDRLAEILQVSESKENN